MRTHKQKIDDLTQSQKQFQEKYYELDNACWTFRQHLSEVKGFKGGSAEFKMLELALSKFQDKLRKDYDLCERLKRREQNICTVKEMQQALNRERKIRHELEKEIEEAKRSSGLFISYVRSKFKKLG